MSNHCLDVICLVCGETWCLRCSSKRKLSKYELKRWIERTEKTPCGILYWKNEVHCGQHKVADY